MEGGGQRLDSYGARRRRALFDRDSQRLAPGFHTDHFNRITPGALRAQGGRNHHLFVKIDRRNFLGRSRGDAVLTPEFFPVAGFPEDFLPGVANAAEHALGEGADRKRPGTVRPGTLQTAKSQTQCNCVDEVHKQFC